MKRSTMLTVTSLLSILLLTFHLAGDIALGYEKGGLSNLMAVPILVVLLCGTLLLANRRSGYVIMLLGSLMALGMPLLHMRGKGVGVGSRVAGSSDAFFFVSTLLALGVTGLFSLILLTVELWTRRRGQSRAV
jgi:hypothetical protein